MTVLARLVFLVAFVAALTWAVVKPDYDSIAAAVAALAALIAAFFLKKDEKSGGQVQNVSGGVAIQAGADVTVRDVKQ